MSRSEDKESDTRFDSNDEIWIENNAGHMKTK